MAKKRRARSRCLTAAEATAAIVTWDALVHKIAWKLHPNASVHDLCDMVSAAQLGVLKAVSTYTPRKGSSLTSWIWLKARGSVIDWLRSSRPRMRLWERGDHPGAPMVLLESDLIHENVVGIAEEFIGAPGRSPLAHISIRGRSNLDGVDIKLDVRRAISQLKRPRDRIIATGVFIRGITSIQIGREIGISESRVSQYLSRIRPLLAVALRDYAPVSLSNVRQGSERLGKRASRRRDASP